MSGSRADAVVRLSYEYGDFEIPQVDEQQAIELAKRKCNVWGYAGAEAFGGTSSVCDSRDKTGSCHHRIVTKEYQCTGW